MSGIGNEMQYAASRGASGTVAFAYFGSFQASTSTVPSTEGN